MPITMNDVVAVDQLESAFAWLWKRRKKHPPDSDIWDFSRRWNQEKEKIGEELLRGKHSFSPLRRITASCPRLIQSLCLENGPVPVVDTTRPRNANLLSCVVFSGRTGEIAPPQPAP